MVLYFRSYSKKSTPSILVASSEEVVDTVYYCENIEYENQDNMKIVYGENPYPSGGVITLPRLVLGYYFILACGFTILIGIIWIIVRRINRANKICKYAFFVPLSYIMSTVFLVCPY